MKFRTAALVSVVAALGAGCGDDDQPARETAQTTRPAAGDVERYCALGRRLDAAGEQFFGRLEREGGSEKEFAAAERRFVRVHADRIAAIEQAAPAAISSEVRIVTAAQRARGGLDPGMEVSQPAAEAAERKVVAFERRNCRRSP